MELNSNPNPNPFIIDIEDKEEYTFEEYQDIQQKLSEKNIDNILNNFYPPIHMHYIYDDFKHRCTNGLRQTLVTNNLPIKQLYTIGTGGNNINCIICCTPFTHEHNEFKNQAKDSRYNASLEIRKSLEEVGYNGALYIFNGGFPNPTGTEMKYAGVPYCFKIFMMLEAKKLGFKNIIWIDSSCYAINNPQRLFDILDEQGTLLSTVSASQNNYNAMVFKPTIDLLNSITNTDIHQANYIRTIVFGLNLHLEHIVKIVEEYYDMVKLGWPFFSIFPEEIVLTSIFNKPEYKHLLYNQYETFRLQIHENFLDINSAREQGYYFLHKCYKLN